MSPWTSIPDTRILALAQLNFTFATKTTVMMIKASVP
jgi:hypothetical protein